MKFKIHRTVKGLFLLFFTIIFAGCQTLSEENKQARQLLLNKGIKYSEQAYIKAVKANDIDTVKLFLSAGMPVDIKYKGYPVLFEPVIDGHLEMVQLLIRNDADVNFQHSAWKFTPLMKASGKFYQPKIVECLLKNGADPLLKERHGYTALDIAFQNGKKDIVEIIRKHIDSTKPK
jgi:ankyrin repeat protein